ncbi:hypothetical protein VNO77_02065 [Canavalia gladiata]|uniref:Uncharacterized protein n=1 Tax=Canavalia gladiata TaxID=3824 RepID=A0AAN9MSJ0_CANGL
MPPYHPEYYVLIGFYRGKLVTKRLVCKGRPSLIKTCFHLIKASSRVDTTSTLQAMASGECLCISLPFVVAFACSYIGTLVKSCRDMNPDIRTFPNIGQRALENKGSLIASIAINSALFQLVTGLEGILSLQLLVFCPLFCGRLKVLLMSFKEYDFGLYSGKCYGPYVGALGFFSVKGVIGYKLTPLKNLYLHSAYP